MAHHMDPNAARLEVGDEEERALLFRVTQLNPEPPDLAEDERKVLSVVGGGCSQAHWM
jgi:hypothetical protein